jgi:hypothetical protein
MDLDDLVSCSGDVDLKLSGFVEGTVHESEKALVSDVRSELSWILFEFIGDVVGMIISVEENILVPFEGSYF